jgi:hypothetical protein
LPDAFRFGIGCSSRHAAHLGLGVACKCTFYLIMHELYSTYTQ